MSEYLLIIYYRPLDDQMMEQISEFAEGARMEEVLDDIRKKVENAYLTLDRAIGQCYIYRLYAKNYPESAFLLDIIPNYTGRFTAKDEDQCAEMGYCIQSLINAVECFNYLSKQHSKKLHLYFQSISQIDKQNFRKTKRELQADFNHVKRTIKKYFRTLEIT